jgi:hypothetical protein
MIAAALLFVSSGVAFAHDWNGRNHKSSGKAYGYYKVQKHHPNWKYKHFKRNPHFGKRYAFKKFHRHHSYKRHGDYKRHHPRPVPRRTVIYKPAKKDPIVMFKIVLKDRR